MLNFTGIKEKVAFYCRSNPLLKSEIARIAKWDSLSAADLRELAEDKAMEMVRHASNRSSFYKKIYSSYNLRDSFNRVYPSLPSINKFEVKRNTAGMATMPFSLLKRAETSGTSGTPFVVYRSPMAIFREHAYVWYFRMLHGLNIGDPIISLRGTLDNQRLFYFNKPENTLYLSSYLLSQTNIKKYAELINEFRPRALHAYPSVAYTLANLVADAGLNVHIPLSFTSSETLYGFQRDQIEQVFQGRLFDWYGAVERTMALGQCAHGAYHSMPLYSIDEFSPNGVISTGLINRGFPLIKYYLDDTFTHLEGTCKCGRENGIRSIEGRFDDAIVLSDGSRITRMSLAFKGYPHLRYSQIIQDDPQSIDVNIVVDPGFSADDEKGLLRKIRLRLDDSIVIRMNRVQEEDIVVTISGKYKLVISRCLAVRRAEVRL